MGFSRTSIRQFRLLPAACFDRFRGIDGLLKGLVVSVLGLSGVSEPFPLGSIEILDNQTDRSKYIIWHHAPGS